MVGVRVGAVVAVAGARVGGGVGRATVGANVAEGFGVGVAGAAQPVVTSAADMSTSKVMRMYLLIGQAPFIGIAIWGITGLCSASKFIPYPGLASPVPSNRKNRRHRIQLEQEATGLVEDAPVRQVPHFWI